MKRRIGVVVLLVISFPVGYLWMTIPSVSAEQCVRGSLSANLVSQGNQASLSLGSASYRCRPPRAAHGERIPGPSYTYEVICNPDSKRGPDTLCSVAPCLRNGQSFALRNLRSVNGSVEPAGYQCLNQAQANVTPGITIAQVFAAIRKVKLPGGTIQAAPAIQGLANLESFFWVDGVSQDPVQLIVNGHVLHAEFRVVEYRWSFGGGEPLVTEGPGRPGLESEVNTTFPRRGVYPVEVTVMWAAEAFLDGRRVGEVDDLVSRAEMSYPVAELRTVLTG
jgi:hypothetical protein